MANISNFDTITITEQVSLNAPGYRYTISVSDTVTVSESESSFRYYSRPVYSDRTAIADTWNKRTAPTSPSYEER